MLPRIAPAVLGRLSDAFAGLERSRCSFPEGLAFPADIREERLLDTE